MTSDDLMSITEELRTAADDIDGYTTAEISQNGGASLGKIRYLDGDGYVNGVFTSKWFRDIADRIDDEMVALPKDGDRKPIHPGDIKYCITNGDMCKIYTIAINSGGAYVTAMVGGGTGHEADVMDLDPCKLTSKTSVPDSLEHIVNDIADFGIGADIDNATLDFLVKIQKRICRIAKESKR